MKSAPHTTPSPTYTLDLTGPYADQSPHAPATPDVPPPDALDTEWLLTNGLGSFAMGTACGCNTRRYHGLLLAAQRPPVQRVNTLAAVHEVVRFNGQTFDLACHEFTAPGSGTVFHPKGWRHLKRFEKDTACRWAFEVGPIRVIKELRLVWKRDLAVLTYRVEPAIGASDTLDAAPQRVTLELVPLVALRDFHHHRRADGGDDLHVSTEPGGDATGPFATPEENSGGGAPTGPGIRVAAPGQPPLHLLVDRGGFAEQYDWWYGFRHRIETSRGQDDTEDLFSPGRFEHTFTGVGGAVCEMKLYMGTAPIDVAACEADDGRGDLLRNMIGHVGREIADDVPETLRQPLAGLVVASHDFVVERTVDDEPMTSILAGYPWFADWGRDAMIALPGLLLCTGRFEEARKTLVVYSEHIRNGLIPNRFDDYGGEPHYNTVDASLWYVHAALEYLRSTGDRATWDSTLADACRRIIKAYKNGTECDIYMDRDGLISAGNMDTQLTWMDAKRGDVVFTPRHGKAVEINALWHRALTGCAEAMADTDPATTDDYRTLAAKVKRSFSRLFWNDDLGYLIDHVNEDGADGSLRPNQLLAVSLPAPLLPLTKQKRIMKTVREKLLTPMGLRTLSPDDPSYRGRYAGSMFERDGAYHQGTVWPWPIGSYVEGYLRAHQFSSAALRHGREALHPLHMELARHGLGQLHEIFDGNPPHRPGGCPAQAWSVAETLRATLMVAGGAVHGK